MKIINQDDHQKIAKLIANLNKPAESCYLLFGPQGVGKSVLATLASKSAKSKVLYVKAPDRMRFSKNLSREMKKLNYMKYLLPKITVSSYYGYEETFHEFEKLAEKRWLVNHTPLLIIDDFKVDQLDLIKMIQRSAKVALQNGSYNVMFIIDDQKSLEFFMDDITLMEFIYLGDLNEDVALSYLYDHQVDRDFAKKIYDIFGGRISDLNQVINYLDRNRENNLNDFVDMKANLIVYKWDKLNWTNERQSKVLEFLCNHSNEPFNRNEFKKLENDSLIDFYDKLVQKNILTTSKNMKITFESPFTKYFFKNLYRKYFNMH
ncbi:hypothetical protein C1645_803560 [Glomus cerebriforme]|uniref:P-loop containing nucleoside triphosphate hydrolase protein n=1 Tax=Glomus cerebriforme TaxID=658196 RepID=A0A397TBT9_9GLOM|nr:hypothetical protein C1645_803560 [Glomus cerebriforme]